MEEEGDTPARILRALRFRPRGMTITETAKQVVATRNSVSKHLEILRIAGRVEVRSVGNAKLYSLAQRVPMSAFLCFTKNLILILDRGGRIVQVNDQCQQALGRSKDDLLPDAGDPNLLRRRGEGVHPSARGHHRAEALRQEHGVPGQDGDGARRPAG